MNLAQIDRRAKRRESLSPVFLNDGAALTGDVVDHDRLIRLDEAKSRSLLRKIRDHDLEGPFRSSTTVRPYEADRRVNLVVSRDRGQIAAQAVQAVARAVQAVLDGVTATFDLALHLPDQTVMGTGGHKRETPETWDKITVRRRAYLWQPSRVVTHRRNATPHTYPHSRTRLAGHGRAANCRYRPGCKDISDIAACGVPGVSCPYGGWLGRHTARFRRCRAHIPGGDVRIPGRISSTVEGPDTEAHVGARREAAPGVGRTIRCHVFTYDAIVDVEPCLVVGVVVPVHLDIVCIDGLDGQVGRAGGGRAPDVQGECVIPRPAGTAVRN